MFAEPALAGSMFIFKISVKIYRSIVMIYREENMNKMKIQQKYKHQQNSGSVVERNDYYPANSHRQQLSAACSRQNNALK